MKKEAYYFSHDANAQDDPKCMILIDTMGMAGYGVFWALIEKLRAEKDYKLPLSIIPSLAKRWGISKEKVQKVVKDYKLFVIDSENQNFYSERLVWSMNEKSIKARESANKRWGNDANALQSHTERIKTHMPNDAIKVKESKVKETSTNVDGIDEKKVFELLRQNTFNTVSSLKIEKKAVEFCEFYKGQKLHSLTAAVKTWADGLNAEFKPVDEKSLEEQRRTKLLKAM